MCILCRYGLEEGALVLVSALGGGPAPAVGGGGVKEEAGKKEDGGAAAPKGVKCEGEKDEDEAGAPEAKRVKTES